jgi:hypothetical protein
MINQTPDEREAMSGQWMAEHRAGQPEDPAR